MIDNTPNDVINLIKIFGNTNQVYSTNNHGQGYIPSKKRLENTEWRLIEKFEHIPYRYGSLSF